MAVVSEDTDFLEYTKKWINEVNRGGLFSLNNIIYQFFIVIEKQVQTILPSHVVKSTESTDVFKQKVIKKISDDEDVQWHWTVISQCIDSNYYILMGYHSGIFTSCISGWRNLPKILRKKYH